VVQALAGFSFVLGVSLFFAHIPESVALYVTDVELSFLVLGVWAAAGCAVTAWVVGRRA
jgi:hypothetical protein